MTTGDWRAHGEDAPTQPTADDRRKLHPRHLGRELAERWGLDPNTVAQIEIVIGPQNTYATVTYATTTLNVDPEAQQMLFDLVLMRPRKPKEN